MKRRARDPEGFARREALRAERAREATERTKRWLEEDAEREANRKACLSWAVAANAILAKGGLREREDDFIRKIRTQMADEAKPKSRATYTLSDKQIRWFRDIYLRVVGSDGGQA